MPKTLPAVEVVPVPCLQDNYAYLIHSHQTNEVVVVDPSEVDPVRDALETRGWKLTEIWNTHHHPDHIGGNEGLKKIYGASVLCSKYDKPRIPSADRSIETTDRWNWGGLDVQALEIPGHTLGHIAFHIPQAKALFCGDTLFSLGCGRLFEGTIEQMWASLQKLCALPGHTFVYFGHEYTLANGLFARTVCPSPQLESYLEQCRKKRDISQPTTPSLLGLEKQINPFLNATSIEQFRERRVLKDTFR